MSVPARMTMVFASDVACVSMVPVVVGVVCAIPATDSSNSACRHFILLPPIFLEVWLLPRSRPACVDRAAPELPAKMSPGEYRRRTHRVRALPPPRLRDARRTSAFAQHL